MLSFSPGQHQSARQRSASPAEPVSSVARHSHEASPALELQKTIGNQGVLRLLRSRRENPASRPRSEDVTRAAADFGPAAVVARGDSHEELKASAVSERVRRAPAGAGPLTSNDSGGVKTLSASGRHYFEPLAGAGAGRARLHVGGRADQLARLAGANALTYGHDVFIPQDRFAPESHEGRALLGHELAHVAQHEPHRPSQVFRQNAVEAHYPTKEEQTEIEKILSRDFKASGVAAPEPGQPAVERGLALNEEQRKELADRLREPYFDAIKALDPGTSSKGSGGISESTGFGVIADARKAIFERFGSYASRQLTLTRDEAATPDARHAADQLLVSFKPAPTLIVATARTITTSADCTVCKNELSQLNEESRTAVKLALIQAALKDRREQLQRITAVSVPGAFYRGESAIRLSLRPREELYKTAVHELMHAIAHPVFNAAFGDEDNINEGFTEYFTQQIVNSPDPSYKQQYDKIVLLRDSMKGPFSSAGGPAAEESLRQAYFRGRLELIGWIPSGKEEEEAVEEAGGSERWNADTAREYAEIYRAQAVALQSAHKNIFGVGLYFAKDADDKIAVRYARVVYQTEPYAKFRLLTEGQILGSPVSKPTSALGASLGVAAEYQEPYFYLQGGVRFVGTAVPGGGAERLDVSAFAGGGIRAWQTIRVGAEGFVLVPLAGQDVQPGRGITFGLGVNVGVEFK